MLELRCAFGHSFRCIMRDGTADVLKGPSMKMSGAEDFVGVFVVGHVAVEDDSE